MQNPVFPPLTCRGAAGAAMKPSLASCPFWMLPFILTFS